MISLGARFFILCLVVGFSTNLTAQEADQILHNANIITMDEKRPSAKSVAVRDGKIIAVGTLEEIAAQKGSKTKMVDVGGRTLLPGFIDSHGHLIYIGLQRSV
ncbi:MAG: amidohydrolase, partial [Gemmataceae bacterium]